MLERDEHVGENAELYALGGLDDLDRARVDRHVSSCEQCAKRVGEAEATMLRLIESGEMPAPPPALDRRIRFVSPRPYAPAWMTAVAAAFVIGLLPWGISTMRERGTVDAMGQQQLAMRAMLAGHFVHVPFQPRVAGAPNAKVLYAREGGWLYVIVGPGADALDVAVVANGTRTTVSSIAGGAGTRFAFIPESAHVDTVQLLDRGAPIADARIVYAVPKERPTHLRTRPA